MSVPGAKSIDSSAAPRTDFDRTRTTPSTMLDRLLDRPGDGDLDVLDRQARRLGDDHDPREGDFGIDAAGHAEHRDDAEGRQQARGQDDQPEVGPGAGDEVDPTGGVRRSVSGSGDQAHFSVSGGAPVFSPAASACTSAFASAFSSADLTGVPSGRLIAPLDDHRLALFEVGPDDSDQPSVRRPDLGVEHHRLAVPDDVQDRSLAQVEDRDRRDLEDAFALVNDDRHANRLPDREPPVRVVDQDADRQVAGLRVGHAADERRPCPPSRCLPRPSRRAPRRGRHRGRSVAGIPMRTDSADRGGSQIDAKTCRVSTTSPIGVPIAIVWPGWQCRLSSTPSIGARIVW